MTNTVQWNDPDTQQAISGSKQPQPMYLVSPGTQKVIEPATSSGPQAADVIATGNITAAQATQGTPVANATVVLALGDGQATWEAQITGLGALSTVAFDGVDDTGVSTNWQSAIGYNTALANPAPITSIAGPGPFIIRGSSSGYEQVRVRCTVYNGTDTIAIRLIGSVGALGGGGPISAPNGSFAVGALADGADTTQGLTTDASVVGDVNGTLSAKTRGLSKIWNDIWDSVNHLFAVNVKQIGGQAATLDNTAILATSMRGKNSVAGDTAVQVNSDGSQWVDIRKYNGSALSYSNPQVSQDQIRAATAAGKHFHASTGIQTSGATNFSGAQLFNPAASGVTLYVYSGVVVYNSANVHQFYMDTETAIGNVTGWTDAAMGKVNMDGGNAGASVAVASYSSTSISTTIGTSFETIGTQNNVPVEAFTNGELIRLTPGNGILFALKTGAAVNWSVTWGWMEY